MALQAQKRHRFILIDAEGGNVVSGLEYKKDGSLSSRALVANADQMHELGHFASKKSTRSGTRHLRRKD